MADALKDSGAKLHDIDFYAWTQDQAAKLRARAAFDNHGDIDWENAAEEIESLGRSERREVSSRLTIILLHLLKWRCQPSLRSGSWKSSIIEQRKMLNRHLQENPSLAALPASVLERDYEVACLKASAETGLPLGAFPENCPFGIAEVLDADFYPG